MNGGDIDDHSPLGRERRRASPLRAALSLLVYTALVLALSFAIVWPLWSLALGAKALFTAAAGAAVGLALLFFAARALLRARRPAR